MEKKPSKQMQAAPGPRTKYSQSINNVSIAEAYTKFNQILNNSNKQKAL